MEELGLAASDSERGLNDYGAARGAAVPAASSPGVPPGVGHGGETPPELAAGTAVLPIRAVTFDVGGTLIEPWPSVGRVYAEVAARHGLEVAAEDLDRQFAE